MLCLEKPLAPDDLLRAIGRVLGINGGTAHGEDRAGWRLSARASAADPAHSPCRGLAPQPEADPLRPGQRGHKVEVAGNGAETLELIQRQDFDLVLMDVQMPIMDGLEATAAIRKLDDAEEGQAADHRHDRPCLQERPGAVPGRRHGRLHQQARQSAGTHRDGGADRR